MGNDTILDLSYNFISGLVQGGVAKIIGALVILLIGFVIGRIIGRFVQRGLHEIEFNNILKKVGYKVKLEDGIGSLVSYIIYIVSVIMALNKIGATSIVIYVILGMLVIFIVISAVLASRDFIPNFAAGMFVLKKEGVVKGNTIKTESVEGKVVSVGMLETRIKNKRNDTILIPNSTLTKGKLIVKKK